MLIKNLHKFLGEVRGAIHVGAHTGEEASWYHECGFTKVLWFEPNINIFPELLDNIKDFPEQIAFNIGIHDTLKEGILHVSNNSGQSSSLLFLGTHSIHHPDIWYVYDIEVSLMRLDEFFEKFKIDVNKFNFLNIDVQGTELNVIKSAGELVKKFDYIYTEINEEELYVGVALVGDIDKYLSQYGFKRQVTVMTKAKWGDALYIKS